ncbi:DUF805 domain-containing protein [Ramlibacter pallidus]|uniref:DUF805 domain-containing protein n=1 Tax=Ramlibacter pallidus TaxID=2780087 RepID=A0ABR9S2K4_9BURK|nr:DUF805 domain-containing protein [Ramlibacter pallidus]MBE7367292.1 DUF805 domain-containing protein [Ramlibacter pallidus]
MDFKQSVITCLKDKYVDFSGRAGRPEFWWFALFTLVVGLVVGMVSDILAMLVNLGLVLPSLAVGARRLHDIGKSGWFQLLWFIPVLGWAVMIYFLVQPTGAANQYGEGPAPAPDAPTALPPGAV